MCKNGHRDPEYNVLMVNNFPFIRKWGLSLLMMLIIFAFSSLPSNELPNFSWADLIVRKSGHMLGYALLALSFWYGLRWDKRRWWLPWLFAILYAITDEFHQSFVPGRHPSPVDVVIDGTGSGLALLIMYILVNQNKERK
jgi:VanZ family protein